MKKNLLTVFVALGLALGASAQAFFEAVTFTGAFAPFGTPYTAKIEGGGLSATDALFTNGDWTSDWTNWYPNKVAYPAATSVVSGDITSDRNISGTVELQGTVHVVNGATLTIAAGTVIRAGLGATLIIAKGSKINAIGTRANPIVFTSIKDVDKRAPGDWAGVLIIGNSQVNTSNGTRQYEALPNDPLALYGGGRGSSLNLAENSGEMRFVRIEFAGYNYLPDQELNGLTLGAVGSGTRINFIQVSYARDDSFEWFGGTSSHKYLVAFAGVDDDFDMDEGYAGNTQFILGVRNPSVFETAAGGTSNGFEHDNNTGLGGSGAIVPGNNNPTPNTAPFISNATMIGPWAARAITPGNKFGRGMEMRSAVATSVYNSVVMGYNTLAQLVHPSTSIQPSIGMRLQTLGGFTPCEYRNTHLIAVNTGSGFAFTGSTSNEPAPAISLSTYFSNGGNSRFSETAANIFQAPITDFVNSATVSFAPKAVITTVPADFTGLIASKTAAPEVFASLPSASVSRSSLAFGTKQVGETFTALTFNLSFANLTGAGVSVTSSSADFTAATSGVTSVAGIVTVNAVKATAGASAGSIVVNFGDSRIVNVTVPVSALLISPAAPILNVSAASLSFTAQELTTGANYTSNNQELLVVRGLNLSADVTVTAPTGYEISLSGPGPYTATLTLPRDANREVKTSIYVQLKSQVQSSSNAGNLTFVSGAASTSVALTANTAAAFTVGSATLDYFTGQVVSTLGGAFNVRGDRLPASITLTPNSADIEVSVVSATAGFAATAVLTTTGRITSTSNNVWVRYIGALAGSSTGVQVGVVSVTGTAVPSAFTIRLNAPGAALANRWILTDAASPLVTALGFSFADAISGTPFLYRASNNTSIGQISVIGTNVATLRANAAFSTNTVYPFTFTGTLDSELASAEITGTGTNFNFAPGFPLHLEDGTLIGLVSTVTSTTMLTLQAPALVSTVNSAFRTSAILFRRPQAVVGIASGIPTTPAPGGIFIDTYTNGLPNPKTATITLTASNLDGIVNVGINPALSASGYMFEIYDGTPTTFAGNSFTLAYTPLANGTVGNKIITVRYVPTNITSLSLPGLNLNAAHSTELLVLANGRALSAGASSSDPRGTTAFTLRGNAQTTLVIPSNKASLAKFSAYRGVASTVQKFNLSGSRVIKDVTISAPANFQLSTSASFVGATNTLVLPASITGLTPSQDINVRYVRSDVGSDNGTISVATEGIAALSVNVSGESVGFTSIVNLAATVVSFTGVTPATVSGTYLTSELTVTATTGFMVSETENGTYTSTLSLVADPSDFGDIMPKTIFVKNMVTGTLSGTGFAGTLTASSTGATSAIINLIDNSSPTSVNEASVTVSKIAVYPNPTEGAATLAVELAGTEVITVTVFNTTGSVASTFSATASGLTTYPINGLSKGIYVIRVATASSVKTLKLVVE